MQKASKEKKSTFYFILRNIYYKIRAKALSYLSLLVRKKYILNYSKKAKKASSDSIMKNGYIYIALGTSFYKECISSAKILKNFTKYPIHLFTDQKEISNKEKELFISIDQVKNLHIRSKVDYISSSPFENTIYLDTDIIVVRDIDELFELLKNYDVLATLDTARKRENISKLIKEYEKIPYAFGEVNGGLLGYSKNAKINILNKWPNVFYKYMDKTGGWDQPSLRILLWKNKTSLYILPPEFNVRSKKLLEKVKNNKIIFGEGHMSPRIYHMHINEDIYTTKESKIISLREIVKKAMKKAYDIIY